MLCEAIVTACELRDGGVTGPQIYASFMRHWREDNKVCLSPDCRFCETATAIGQRIILAVLAAIEAEPSRRRPAR
jgi:hypothetical protein